MIVESKTGWLKLDPEAVRTGSTYAVIGVDGSSVNIEGWLNFPKGTTEVSIVICTKREGE